VFSQALSADLLPCTALSGNDFAGPSVSTTRYLTKLKTLRQHNGLMTKKRERFDEKQIQY